MPALQPNLHTTILQAFARTVVDESRRDNDASDAGDEAFYTPSPSVVVLPGEGDLVGEHYKLVRLLGQGMFGKVYVAQRVDVPEHQVALKLLPRSLYAGRNVERELVMLATVGHPHLVQLKDHGTTADYVWLTMPVYHGETLAERLERGPLGLHEAHDIFEAVARGLAALHAAGLRHQDVKPENIYLAVFGGRIHPIILDLGVAAEKDAAFVAGTALYAAPEQVAALTGAHPAALPLSEKMDTYGLAATLLMALVGPDLFPGETATDRQQLERAHTIRAHDPLHPDALPNLAGKPREQIKGALARWMALDQDARPGMTEIAEELTVLLEPEREEQRREEERRGRQRATILRFKKVFAGIGLCVLSGAAMMYNKRETLKLASKLAEAREQAEREGKESFTKIETCVASHRMATMAVSSCEATLVKDRATFKQAIDDVMKSGPGSQSDHARQVQVYMNRIKTCEDVVTTTQKTCADESARAAEEKAKQKALLDKEREESKALSDGARAQIAALEKERDRLAGERLTCAEERDACRRAAESVAGAPAATGAAAPGPAPTGGHPAAGPQPAGGAIPAVAPATTVTPGASVMPLAPPPAHSAPAPPAP